MSETRPPDPPSPFVVRSIQLLSTIFAGAPGPTSGRGRALDVAMGRGRHTQELAGAGWTVYGVDRDVSAVAEAVARVRASGHYLRAWCADLTVYPLPRNRFELILVTRYLQRSLFPSLRDALTPGGVIIYETFTTAQLTAGQAHGRGPTSPDHLLAPGELRDRFSGFEELFYEEVTGPDAYARLCARKT